MIFGILDKWKACSYVTGPRAGLAGNETSYSKDDAWFRFHTPKKPTNGSWKLTWREFYKFSVNLELSPFKKLKAELFIFRPILEKQP